MLHVKGQKLIFIPLNGTKKLRGFTIINSFVDFFNCSVRKRLFFYSFSMLPNCRGSTNSRDEPGFPRSVQHREWRGCNQKVWTKRKYNGMQSGWNKERYMVNFSFNR